jgi:hypothetical protein
MAIWHGSYRLPSVSLGRKGVGASKLETMVRVPALVDPRPAEPSSLGISGQNRAASGLDVGDLREFKAPRGESSPENRGRRSHPRQDDSPRRTRKKS